VGCGPQFVNCLVMLLSSGEGLDFVMPTKAAPDWMRVQIRVVCVSVQLYCIAVSGLSLESTSFR